MLLGSVHRQISSAPNETKGVLIRTARMHPRTWESFQLGN
jgi:hypothetical protein